MSDPYADEEGFGHELGKTVKLVAWALYDWSQKHDKKALHSISFDKLFELVCRYWEALKDAGIVSFCPPTEQHYGDHGPTQTLARNPDLGSKIPYPFVYPDEIIELFMAPMRGKHILFKIDATRNFHPGITCAHTEGWESDSLFLNDVEKGVFQTMRNALAPLSAREIRVLGTHAGNQGTKKALTTISRKWAKELSEALSSPQGQMTLALEKNTRYALVLAREMVWKSSANKEPYRKALGKLRQAVKGTKMERIVDDTQHPASEIWQDGDREMAQWRKISKVCFAFTVFARASMTRAKEMKGEFVAREERRDLRLAQRSYSQIKKDIPVAVLGDAGPLNTELSCGGATSASVAKALPQIDSLAEAIMQGDGLQWLARLHNRICEEYSLGL